MIFYSTPNCQTCHNPVKTTQALMAERNKADGRINSRCALTPKCFSCGNCALFLIDFKKATEEGDFKGSHAWFGRAEYLGLGEEVRDMFSSESLGIENKK